MLGNMLDDIGLELLSQSPITAANQLPSNASDRGNLVFYAGASFTDTLTGQAITSGHTYYWLAASNIWVDYSVGGGGGGTGDVTGPGSSQNNYLATYDGITSTLLSNGATISAVGNTLTANGSTDASLDAPETALSLNAGYGINISSETINLNSDTTNISSNFYTNFNGTVITGQCEYISNVTASSYDLTQDNVSDHIVLHSY